MVGTIRKIWAEERSLLDAKERRSVAWLVAAAIIAATAEVAILCAVYPVAAAVSGSASNGYAGIWLAKNSPAAVMTGFCVLYTLRVLISSGFSHKVTHHSHGIERNLRNRLFRRLISDATLSSTDLRNPSVMSNTLNRTIAQWAGSGAALLAAGYQALVAIGIVIASSSLLERREFIVPIGALAGIAIAWFIRLHRTQLKVAVETEQETHHRILTIAGLSMQALREIRVLGKAETFIRMLSEEGQRRFQSARTLILLTQLPRLASELLLFTAFGAIALTYIAFHGSLSGLYPLLGMLLVATARLIPALNLVFNSAVTYRVHRIATMSILDRIKILDTATAATRGGFVPVLAEEIRFEDVAFAYPERSWRLNVRSWSIRAGTLVTVNGPSGYGKSTLLDLLCGFLTPTGGRITVDGVDLLGASTSWQSQLAYLPQVAAMMDGTLADNIALGESPGERDATKLEWVSRQCLADVLESLPGGLLGKLDERGANLSGGQRQRVGLARALYFGRKVLVLDEPTASLDRASAQRVVDLLADLKKTHTVLIATHDPAFERIADDTLHLDAQKESAEGRVA